MKYNNKKEEYTHVLKISVFLIMLLLCFGFISSVSASSYDVSSDLSNDDIQNIIDSSSSGDSINFLDGSYNDVSLIVDKKLNIISNPSSSANDNVSETERTNNGSIMHTSNSINSKAENMGINKSFGFYFTQNSIGSILSGFTLIGNADYGIILNGTSNVNLKNNTIDGVKGGILIENSSFTSIANCTIENTGENGILVQGSNDINIFNNTIRNNTRSGIHLSNTDKVTITDNIIYQNQFNGISLYDSTENTYINHNELYQNLNGIYINSKTKDDIITANTIYDSRINPSSELGSFETGNGVLIGPSYEKTSRNIKIYYNSILNNENYGVKNNPSFTPMTIGANWYGSNDPSQTFICPLLLGNILKAELLETANSFQVVFKDGGSVVGDIGKTNVNFQADNDNAISVSVENAVATINKSAIDPNNNHNEIKAVAGKQVLSKVIDKIKNLTTSTDSNKDNSNDLTKEDIDQLTQEIISSNNQNKYDGNNQGSLSANGLGSGDNAQTSGSGSSNGNSNNNMTKSGSSVGEDKEQNDVKTNDESSEGSSDSSESQSGKSFELATKEISKKITQNSPLIIAFIVLCIVIFVFGYRRKNKFN